MSLEKDQRLIAEYVEWSARMKTMAHDVSPERFTIERAKQEAFERVEGAVKELENYDSLWLGHASEQAALLQRLNKILTGDDE